MKVWAEKKAMGHARAVSGFQYSSTLVHTALGSLHWVIVRNVPHEALAGSYQCSAVQQYGAYASTAGVLAYSTYLRRGRGRGGRL